VPHYGTTPVSKSWWTTPPAYRSYGYTGRSNVRWGSFYYYWMIRRSFTCQRQSGAAYRTRRANECNARAEERNGTSGAAEWDVDDDFDRDVLMDSSFIPADVVWPVLFRVFSLESVGVMSDLRGIGRPWDPDVLISVETAGIAEVDFNGAGGGANPFGGAVATWVVAGLLAFWMALA